MKNGICTRAVRGRRAGTNAIAVVLLACILIALIVLIAVVLMGKEGPPIVDHGGKPGASSGEIVKASPPQKSPKALDDPNRLKQTLQEGKTYAILLKAGFDARVESKEWGVKQIVNMGYLAEMAIERTIEKNDGKRVVELRHFVKSRNVKLLCDAESVKIELGNRADLLLGALDTVVPGTTTAVAVIKPVAESILGYGAQQAIESEATKAFARVDSLSGKKVRITYVDGYGVESVEPVDCNLDRDEMEFITGTAVLSDCFIWDLKKAPGQRWTVDGAQLSGFIDPSLRGRTDGDIELIRDKDQDENGKSYATLRIEGGALTIDSSDRSARRLGTFSPEGTLQFSLSDKIVERAKLTGNFNIEEVSKDHLLFETTFKTRPKLNVRYSCSIR